MATKRKTDHHSERPPRQPDGSEAAEPEMPVPEATAREARAPEATARDEPVSDAPAPAAGEPEAAPADGAATPDGAAAGDLDRKSEDLVSQLEEARDRHLRLAADFDNFKRRARQEQLDTMRYAAAAVAERLLPVLDDADRALSHAPEGVDEGWLKGVRLTFQQLEDIMASVGVERIRAMGSQFDPKLHEAVGSEETSDQPEDTVVVELRPGYRMHDRVLRPALVKVARPPALNG